MAVSPQYLYSGLKQRGLSDPQIYATLGNWKQESELNPGAINPGEGAIGLDQWRLGRRAALERFATASNRSPADPDAQMDFYIHELQQHPGGQAFLAAKDIPSANAALKTYIAYGSPYNQGGEGTRLQNALAYAKQFGDSNAQPQQYALQPEGKGPPKNIGPDIAGLESPKPQQAYTAAKAAPSGGGGLPTPAQPAQPPSLWSTVADAGSAFGKGMTGNPYTAPPIPPTPGAARIDESAVPTVDPQQQQVNQQRMQMALQLLNAGRLV